MPPIYKPKYEVLRYLSYVSTSINRVYFDKSRQYDSDKPSLEYIPFFDLVGISHIPGADLFRLTNLKSDLFRLDQF